MEKHNINPTYISSTGYNINLCLKPHHKQFTDIILGNKISLSQFTTQNFKDEINLFKQYYVQWRINFNRVHDKQCVTLIILYLQMCVKNIYIKTA